MSQRILMSFTITVAFSLAILAQAASAKPVPVVETPYLSEGYNVVVAPQKPESQKPASMSYAEYRALMLRSEALNKAYGTVQSSRPIVSEKLGGLGLSRSSTATQVVSTGNEFDWSDAGIGAGVIFGTLLLGAGLVLTVRRRDFPIAH